MAATCTALHSASCHWFTAVGATLRVGDENAARGWRLRCCATKVSVARSIHALLACLKRQAIMQRHAPPTAFPACPPACLPAVPAHLTVQGGKEGTAALASLPALTCLELRNWYIDPLPPGVGVLSALRRLSIHRSGITIYGPGSLPDRLRHLASLAGTLAELELTACCLREVPNALAALTALTRLSLAGNPRLRLGGTLTRLLPLASLAALDLSACGLYGCRRRCASCSCQR